MDSNTQQPMPSQPIQQQNAQTASTSSQSLLPKALLVFVGLVIVLILIGGAYYLGTLKSTNTISQEKSIPINPTKTTTAAPTSIPTTMINITESWQTYTNIKYGYTVKYPTTWFDKGDFTSTPVIDSEHYISNENTKYDTLDSKGVYIYIKKILSFVNGSQTNLTAPEYFDIRYKQTTGVTSLTIDGQPAVKYSINQMNYASHAGDKNAHVVTYAILVNNKDVYEIDLQGWYDNAVLTNEKLFDQIVSTFHFTN